MKKVVGAVLVVSALVALVTVLFNRAQPSEEDRTVAIALAASAKGAIGSGKEQVLWEASRGRVFINAYGFSDAAREDRLLKELKSHLGKERYPGTVTVSFFPPREYDVEELPNGKKVSRLKQAEATRRVVLVEAK